MNIEQAVLETLKQLPLNQQEEVLNFCEFLKQKSSISPPSLNSNLTPEQKIEKWHKVIAKLPQETAKLPDAALHRDTMYEDKY
jgi:Protein of unknown function (DUF2281)